MRGCEALPFFITIILKKAAHSKDFMVELYINRTDETSMNIEQEKFPEHSYEVELPNHPDNEKFNCCELDKQGLVKKIIEATKEFDEIAVYRKNAHNSYDPHIACNANWYRFENNMAIPLKNKLGAEGLSIGVTISGATGENDDLLEIGRAVYSETNY